MAEQHETCRFWPLCAVHRGLPRPRGFSREAREQLREDLAECGDLAAVARRWETTRQTVWRITRYEEKPGRVDRDGE